MNHSSGPAPDSAAKSGDDTAARTWVSLHRLSKTFGPAQVLQEVDLDVRAAEIHGLVGQNGSGKSTLIKVLSGVHSADPGSVIEVNGARLSNPVRPAELRRHGLAFVHQDLGLVDECTVMENIRLGQFRVRPVSRRVDWSAERRVAEETLERLHTQIDPSRLVGSLTVGERVIVAIGRALQSIVPGGGCIVFDESTRTLPREILPDFYEIVRRLAASGTAVIIVSHRLDEVLKLADRVSVLRDGRLVAAGRPTRDLSEASLAALLLGRELELLEERPRSRAGTSSSPAAASGTRPGPVLSARDLASGSLRGIDFSAEAGEIVGVTGPTGSGHAELPYVLAGVTRPASGTVSVDGREFALPVRDPEQLITAGVVLVPEDRAREGLAVKLSAEENLTLPRARRHGRLMLRSGWQAREFAQAAALLGIVPPRRHLPCSAFSGGNQQKILLAKWLLHRPRVVLLHEPTQAVDVGARMDILRALRATAATGVCVIVVSAESQDLAAICDRVVVLRDGAVAAELADEPTHNAITAATYPAA
jgi:ribose transport system ATP-binding protein